MIANNPRGCLSSPPLSLPGLGQYFYCGCRSLWILTRSDLWKNNPDSAPTFERKKRTLILSKCNFGQEILQEKFEFIGILKRDGPDIKLDGYPAHSKSWLSGLSLILNSHHILKIISGAYLISKTWSESKKTTGSTTLPFIITNKIRNPRTGSKTLYTTCLSQW